ncbi:MAG: hypothetical protein ABFS86_02885, partial [Planctomycetota bacterium]
MIRALIFAGLLPLLAAASPWANVDKETARRMVRLARDAEKTEQKAARREILTRVIELQPENSPARTGLLYSKDKESGEWVRKLDDRVAVMNWEDADPAEGAKLLEDLHELECWRSRRYVRLWLKKSESKRDREVLEALLLRTPREASVHEALGHPKMGGLFVRPELAPLVRGRKTIVARWRACRKKEIEATPAEELFPVAGVPNDLATVGADGQEFVSTFGEDETVRIAVEARRSYAFVAQLLGAKAEPWAPYRFCLLDSIGYRRMIYALHDDPEEQGSRLKFSSYEHEDYLALQADTVDKAFDTVSHTIAYKTMQLSIAPGEGDERDSEPYAFMKEGFGYLVSLEMYGTATTWFHSGTESAQKVTSLSPPPEVKNTATLTKWLQKNARSGQLLTMPQVFGRSLNNLDFLASIQAWSFLKFLALKDPAAFRNFPLFLREKEEGSWPDRVAESLKQSFDLPVKDLERQWRAWLLEIE